MDYLYDEIQSTIEHTRANFGTIPREFNWFERTFYLRINPPKWMDDHDKRYVQLYRDQDVLFREGVIVWGYVIQANEMLFRRGRSDHPGAIVYSMHPAIDTDPFILNRAAEALFAVKGDKCAEDLQNFADILANEYVAHWRLPVPTRLTEGIPCYYMSTMIIRKHLPKRRLTDAFFPLLVCPARTVVGMILPGKYWHS